jgi:hypothetical protein
VGLSNGYLIDLMQGGKNTQFCQEFYPLMKEGQYFALLYDFQEALISCFNN